MLEPHVLRYVLRAIEAFPEPTPDGQDKFHIEKALETVMELADEVTLLEGQIEELESDLRDAKHLADEYETDAENAQREVVETEAEVRRLQVELEKRHAAMLGM